MGQPSLEYLAGFVDGEGCVYIRRLTRPGGFEVRLAAAQNDRRPLDALASRYGGSVRGPLSYNGNKRSHYRWEVTAKQAEMALTELLPLLIVKREKADLALQLRRMTLQKWGGCATLPSGLIAEREALVSQFNNLNRT